MKNKNLGNIYLGEDESIFLALNDDLIDKIHDLNLIGEAMDLVSEIEKFMLKILDREDD